MFAPRQPDRRYEKGVRATLFVCKQRQRQRYQVCLTQDGLAAALRREYGRPCSYASSKCHNLNLALLANRDLFSYRRREEKEVLEISSQKKKILLAGIYFLLVILSTVLYSSTKIRYHCTMNEQPFSNYSITVSSRTQTHTKDTVFVLSYLELPC